MASIFQSLLKDNHTRELYLKVELIDPNEPEWINTNTSSIPYTYDSSLNTINLNLSNFNEGYRYYGIAVGDILKTYPNETSPSNDIFNQYSFPVLDTSLNGATLGVTLTSVGITTLSGSGTATPGRFYFIRKEIFGKVLSGNINVDVNNVVRRTINLGFSVDLLDQYASLKVTDFQNKRIKIYVGLKNLYNTIANDQVEHNSLPPDSNNIIWFRMGVFNVTNIAMEHSVDSISINMTAQDKSALIDGSASGVFGESPATQYYDQRTAVSYYDTIVDFLTTYSSQQSNKLQINFGDEDYQNFFVNKPSYNSGTTFTFSLLNYNTFTTIGSPGSSTAGGLVIPAGMTVKSNFYWGNSYTTQFGITLYYGIGYSIATKGLTLAGYTSINSTSVIATNVWTELKPIQPKEDSNKNVYYEDQPLQFNANDTVLTALQNIGSNSNLPNLKFYFDENGDFILTQDLLTLNVNSYPDPFNLKATTYFKNNIPIDTSFSEFFTDSQLVNSYSYQKRFAGLKNDLSIFGKNGVAYALGLTTPYEPIGATTYVPLDMDVLYHTIITSLPLAVRQSGFSGGYGYDINGLTYGHPYQQYIIDNTSINPATNTSLGLAILKDYQPELKARFEFKPVPGITEWSSGFSFLGISGTTVNVGGISYAAGGTVFIGKNYNYYGVTTGFNLSDWPSPALNYPTHIAGTYKGLQYLGTYNPYYGIYRKIQPTDSGALSKTYGGVTFYYIRSGSIDYFGIYRSKNTGSPNIDFDITTPKGNWTSWLYWFDILDEKINFWSSSVGYSAGTAVFYNDKTYKNYIDISAGSTNPTAGTTVWYVARQGYGLYDLSIEKQGVKKVRIDDDNVNTSFRKTIDPFTNIPQIVVVRNSIAYNIDEYNTRLNYLLTNLSNSGITTVYLLLSDRGPQYTSDFYNKLLLVDNASKFDAFTQMKQALYKYATLEDNVSMQTMPVYAFDVDQKIHIIDSQMNVDSDYYIRSMSVPFDSDGMMSLEGIKITPLFMGSGLNNPSAIEVSTYTTTAAPGVTIKRYFITDSSNNTLNIFDSTTANPLSVISLPVTANDLKEITYYKDTNQINKLFMLNSNLYLNVYDISNAGLSTTINLENYLSGARSQYYGADLLLAGNTISVLCKPRTSSYDTKIINLNATTYTTTTATIQTISQSNMPVSGTDKISFTGDTINGYLTFYTYNNSQPIIYSFSGLGGNVLSPVLVSTNNISLYQPQLSAGFKSTNSSKIQFFSGVTVGGSTTGYYVVGDNNIIRLRNIANSFSATAYTFGAFDLDKNNTINVIDLGQAQTNYASNPATSNDFRSFFTTTALTEMVLNGTILKPTLQTTYPTGSTINYSFSAVNFGTYSITSTPVFGYTVGSLTGSGLGATVGLLTSIVPTFYLQSQEIGSGTKNYSSVVKDTNTSSGSFIGTENIFLHPTDGIYIVAGSNIYLAGYTLTNNSAQLIFT